MLSSAFVRLFVSRITQYSTDFHKIPIRLLIVLVIGYFSINFVMSIIHVRGKLGSMMNGERLRLTEGRNVL